MQAALNVSLSAQIALERRLTTIADNVANMSTAGFHTTQVKFMEVLQDMKNNVGTKISFVSQGSEYLSTHTGDIIKTGNPLDFALKGNVWFALQSPQGMILTRDGRFKIEKNGELVSLAGYPVLDITNMPIHLHQKDKNFEVYSDGTLYQSGKNVGVLGFYSADLSGGFIRHNNSGFVPKEEPLQVLERSYISVKQGYIEQSNTNSIHEISKLIRIQNEFENISSVINNSESSLLEAIKIFSS
ncbi:Flagellar basal-body rod protein FlgF [Liberibacter crescens BT-1]|uniref:Flagellar basal-body rod protein FlgF n=1 Tax=Liberibacter crescens (strain BT-1) TaxID=1215343 RepID=L0ERQ8_LIBCB|nr:flagellar basal-body rod protein FlgF [Liberibacter crescens]AGA64179.1 Flagellar basal-body rod protein FlgF [Liberibacter crescens BT-1]AMC12441.1 flagellar basal body rod protein FlgF [Liberibacter crescens]